MKLLPWIATAAMSATMALQAAGDAPATAVWTGGGDRNVLSDPANWTCKDSSGNVIEGAVPDASATAVTVTGATSFNCPAGATPVWKTLAVSGTVSLTADCDWRGAGSIFNYVNAGSTLNLKGFNLRVAVPNAYANRRINVTDDSPAGSGGEFHFEVAEGQTFRNGCLWADDNQFWFSGSVHVVKDGKGSYNIGAAHSATGLRFYKHTGGTTVHEGLMFINNDAETTAKNDYSAYYSQASNRRPVFGQPGSSITIESGGTFDYKGVYALHEYKMYLNGGTFTNTRKPFYPEWGSNGELTFGADSKIAIARDAHISGPFKLNGHKLAGTIAANQIWYCRNGSARNGRVELSGAGEYRVYMNAIDSTDNVTYDIACALNVQQSFAVSNYIARYEGSSNAGSAVMSVCGTFTPVTDRFYPVTLKNGATIDLSAKDGPWPATGAFGAVKYAADCTTLTVDVGERTVASGDRLIAWESAPFGTEFLLKGENTADFAAVVSTDGLYVRSTASPAYATWNVGTSAWNYFTADGTDITADWTGGITPFIEIRFSSPAEYAKIYSERETLSPSGYLLTALVLEEGAGAVDFSGMDFRVAQDIVIDVKGGSLTLPNSLIAGSVPFTVTSSAAGGSLVVDVPKGVTVENTSVTLGGLLRLVKRGEGTFVPTKLYQPYTGGNEIAAGTVKLSTAHNQADGYFNELGGFVQGTGSYADVEILPGATVDQNGQTGLRSYNFILKGGTLTNTKTDFGTNLAMFFRIALRDAERSYFTLPSGISTGFYADLDGETTLDLGGKTLQLAIASSKLFYLNNTTITNGTLDVVTGGSLRTMRTPSNARHASINLNAALYLEQALSVSNIVVKFNGDWDQGTAALKVYGAFRPEASGGYFYGPTMQDGSTLDFSAWNADTLGWPVKSRSTRFSPSKDVRFAADATGVKVKLGDLERTKTLARSADPYILKWGNGAEKPSGAVEFAFADDDPAAGRGYELTSDNTGVKVAVKPGFIIFIAENKEIEIPGPWVAAKHAGFWDATESDIKTWLGGTGANGLPRWQSWLLGLEPADAKSVVLCRAVETQPGDGTFAVGANIDVQADSGADVTAYLDTSADGKTWAEKVASQALSDGGTVSFSRTLASGERGFYRIRLAVQ